MRGDLFISLWLQDMHLWSARSAFQDKLLEEMWKQQDSLEAPADTAAETPASPEAGGGPEENIKDSNPLLERLRALEVPPSPSAQLCVHVVSFHFWNVRLIDREYHVLFNQMYFIWSRRKLKDSTWERPLLFHLPDVPSLQAFVSYFGRITDRQQSVDLMQINNLICIFSYWHSSFKTF